MNEVCYVFAAVHLWEDSQRSCTQTNTHTHTHIHTCITQVYWLSPHLCTCTHPYRDTSISTYTHTLAQCVWPDKLLPPTSHPFIYPVLCPVSLHLSPSCLFLPLFWYKPTLQLHLLPYRCLLPQITAAERLNGQREMVKKRERENVKGKGGVSGGLTQQQKTSGHPSQAYLLTQGHWMSSQLAGSTRMEK